MRQLLSYLSQSPEKLSSVKNRPVSDSPDSPVSSIHK